MIDFRNALEVRLFDGTSFSDFKYEAQDFSRDSFDVTITADNYLYVGFYKPINAFYVDMLTPNTSLALLSGEYFNGVSFTALRGYLDETKNFTRSGFISWSRNLENESSTKINDSKKYWYRFKVSIPTSKITFNAINILFSDDQSLLMKYNKILSDEFLDGELNYNKVHATCRDEIIELFRRKGFKKYNESIISTFPRMDQSYLQITAWDVHDLFEVKEAATYLALHKIFFDLSDRPDDTWASKSKYYHDLYKESLDRATLSLDTNDDGKVDIVETSAPCTIKQIMR